MNDSFWPGGTTPRNLELSGAEVEIGASATARIDPTRDAVQLRANLALKLNVRQQKIVFLLLD
jgi:hypothetical protein